MAGVRDEAARILDAFTLADALTQEDNM